MELNTLKRVRSPGERNPEFLPYELQDVKGLENDQLSASSGGPDWTPQLGRSRAMPAWVPSGAVTGATAALSQKGKKVSVRRETRPEFWLEQSASLPSPR